MARNTQKDADAPQTGAETPENGATPDAPDMVEGQHNPAVHALLTQAKSLDDEKDALYKRIAANRDILRNYKTVGLLSDEQGAAIDEFYPVRTKKSGDDAPAETPAS